MKKDIEISEWIESFLNGDLTPEELMLFENRKAIDPLFASEIDRHRMIRDLITNGTYLKIKNELKNIHREARQKRIKRIKGAGFGGLLLLMILSVIVLINKDENGSEKVVPDTAIAGTAGQADKPENFTDTLTDFQQESVTPDAVKETEQSASPALGTAPGAETIQDSVYPDINNHRQELPEIKEMQSITGNNHREVTNEKLVFDCSTIIIKGQFDQTESCNNRPSGSIIVDLATIRGGSAPYVFSISKDAFRDTTVFTGLLPGNYTLYVRDANNCVSIIGTAFIATVDCMYQAVFAPFRGEIWEVPTDREKSGTINIFSKTGILVYSAQFNSQESVTWDGSSSGQMLPMGLYQFHILYTDQTSFTGTVTIVR